jgi:hypothetical protein
LNESSGAASLFVAAFRVDLARGARGVAVVVRRRVVFLGASPALDSALAGEESSFFGGMFDLVVTVNGREPDQERGETAAAINRLQVARRPAG